MVKPSHQLIDITLTGKESELHDASSIVFQNFYTATISIKQFQASAGSDVNNPKSWKTVLNNYQLMKDPHCERDA